MLTIRPPKLLVMTLLLLFVSDGNNCILLIVTNNKTGCHLQNKKSPKLFTNLNVVLNLQ